MKNANVISSVGWTIDTEQTIEFPAQILDYPLKIDNRPLNRDSKTLIFCTTYCTGMYEWTNRIQRWLQGIEISGIQHDALVMIDDGSPVLPDWSGVPVYNSVESISDVHKKFIFHFENNLGRSALFNMPGWYRSFTSSFLLAKKLGCNRIVHIESDAFILSDRLVRFLDTTDGWTALWAHSKGVPETGIQVIAPDAMKLFEHVASLPYDLYQGKLIELELPFTRVDKTFIGDRYGEKMTFVPWQADWTMQTHELGYTSALPDYFWFLDPRRKYDLSYRPDLRARWIEHSKNFITATGDVAWCVPFEGEDRWFHARADGRDAIPSLVVESIARMSAKAADANSVPGRQYVDVSLSKSGRIRIPAIRIWKASSNIYIPGEILAVVEIDEIYEWHVRYNTSGTMTYG